jgi:hypothetical protein
VSVRVWTFESAVEVGGRYGIRDYPDFNNPSGSQCLNFLLALHPLGSYILPPVNAFTFVYSRLQIVQHTGGSHQEGWNWVRTDYSLPL